VVQRALSVDIEVDEADLEDFVSFGIYQGGNTALLSTLERAHG
jgi:hypothetical protein